MNYAQNFTASLKPVNYKISEQRGHQKVLITFQKLS
jgi:hypothetical protein